MRRVNLEYVNELLTQTINTLSKLQRDLAAEIEAANPPADARLTRAEWQRVNAEEAALADERARETAKQSVALGNTDAGTVKQADAAKDADKGKAADTGKDK